MSLREENEVREMMKVLIETIESIKKYNPDDFIGKQAILTLEDEIEVLKWVLKEPSEFGI